MTIRNSISATELAKLGKCKSMVKSSKGVAVSKDNSAVYWGNRHHEDFENNVERYMRGRKR